MRSAPRDEEVVWLRARSELPLVTAIKDGSRRLVAAASPAAWALGLRPGHPLAQAQASVPGLEVVDADPEGDRAALDRLAAWCLRYGPIVQADPPDGVLIDTEGAAHLLGGEEALLADLLGRLARAGFAAHAALAATSGGAWALARHRPGAIVPPWGLADALAPLPVAALRLDPETTRGLVLLGIERIGDLDSFPRATLVLRFGGALMARRDRAFGLAADPLVPLVPVTIASVRRAFAEPLTHIEGLAAWIGRLVPDLCRMLEARRAGLRQLDALFRRLDGRPVAIRIGTAMPSRDPAHLVRLLGERLAEVDPGFGIDEILLAAPRTEPLAERQLDAASLDPGREAGQAALAPLVDRLSVRLGAGRVFRAVPVDSRMPERAVRRVPALSAISGSSWPRALPRPSRLIEPPEPVTAIAIVPDDPPTFFVWRKVRYIVAGADGPERVRGEWWREDREVSSLRDYYRVEDSKGRRFWLFRDAPMADGGRWWLHGRFA